jgi:hypothetical protein
MNNLTKTQKANTTENQYFVLENDYIGYLNDGKKYTNYVDAMNALNIWIFENVYLNDGSTFFELYPKSYFAIEMVDLNKFDKYGENKRKPVHKITARQLKQMNFA